MKKHSSEQFDVLSNTLRVLPEEILRLEYFITKINEPEEGISNIEVSFVNVFNQIYGMMCCLKDDGYISTIYDSDAITTALCIRHVLQHQTGRIKNNLRDTLKNQTGPKPSLINYSASDSGLADTPFYINAKWIQDNINSGNNSKRLTQINAYLNLDQIKHKIELNSGSWQYAYICAMPIITEAVRQIVTKYGSYFAPLGFDSKVYYKHFKTINPIDTADYAIITP